MPCTLVTWLCGGGDGENTDSANITLADNDTAVGNYTESARGGGYVGDPMLYILVVLIFYAGSITLFMVTYIRKQNEERQFDSDYNTFVRRVGFDEKLMEAKNKAAMRLKEIAVGKKKTVEPLQEVTVQAQEVTVTSAV